MRSLLGRLHEGEVLVADGAIGTMLMERGLEAGRCPESINLERPEIAEEIASIYLKAGADMIQTNTFGASVLKLALYWLDDQTEEINRQAVRSARVAAGTGAYVAGSCGPSGTVPKPFGETEPEEIYEGFQRQMAALVDEGVDLILVETMSDLTEAVLAVRAAKTVSSSVPVAATMTFDQTPKGFHTVWGAGIRESVGSLEDAGADVVGSNCGNGIEEMIAVAREFRLHTKLPLLIQANAGVPEMKDGTACYPETPGLFAEKAAGLIDAGVSILGGCCGTTPDHIRALRQAVDSS